MSQTVEIFRSQAAEFPCDVEVAEQSAPDEQGARLPGRLVQGLGGDNHLLRLQPAAAGVVQPVDAFQNALIGGSLSVQRGKLRRVDERRDGADGEIFRAGRSGEDGAKRQRYQKFSEAIRSLRTILLALASPNP